MSQSSALTSEQKADVALRRKNGIRGAAFLSAFLLVIYFFIAQFVGIPGFIIFALIVTLFWWSVLRKNAYMPKLTTPSHIAPAIQPPAAPQEPTQAIRSSPSPSRRILPSAPQPTEESKHAPPINTLDPTFSPLLHSPVFSDKEKALFQLQTILSEVLAEKEKEDQSQPTPTSTRPAPLAALPAEPQERTSVQVEKTLVSQPTQQGAVGSGRSEMGKDTQTGQLVNISQANRRQGLYMIGVNGTGKSTLLAHLIVQDIEQGLGVCLLDPHGDLTTQVLARVPENRVADVVLLDLMDSGYPFGLNLFECPNAEDIEQVAFTAGFVMHVFEKVWGVGTETPLLSQFLRNVTYTLISNPGMTFAEIPHLLVDETAREKLVGNVKNNQVRLFWQTYNRLRSNDQLERASGTLNKADAFLTQPIIANIVGQRKATVNFRNIMDTGKILLVQLTPRLEDISNLIGAVIIGQLLNAALSRKDIPEEKRRQFNLYADEFQRFATEDFATLLSEARKFGVATTIAHQYLDQLDHANRGASVNAANLVVFRVSGQDAPELAKEFDSTPPPPEIIGQKPIYSPKRNVVDHLIKNGHKDPTINRFTSTYLVRLDDVLTRYATNVKSQ